MKKKYIAPKATIECRFAEVMQMNLNSVGQQGSVTGESDTNWEFGDDGKPTDNPDAKKFNLWDDWE